jgi:hypothetical protein
MSFALVSLLGCGLSLAAEPEKPAPLRYLRPEGDTFVLESEVSTTRAGDGTTTYVSRTERGAEKMTLTIRSDKSGRPLTAESVLEDRDGKKTANLDLQGPMAQFKRGGVTDFFKAPADPVVTTAPDWSDVFLLVRRYDAAKGGKQDFNGLWFHPTKGLLKPTFTVEHLGGDKVKIGDKEVTLDRYQVKLRGGDYLVWAEGKDRVCKILAGDPKAVPVVLEGYETATRDLK